jgi:hypothetical protein
MIMRIRPLVLAVVLCFSGRAWADETPSLDRFTEIATKIAREFAPDDPEAQAVEAMEIVLKAGIEAAKRNPRLDDKGLEAALKPYAEAVTVAAKGQEEYGLAYNRLIPHIATRQGRGVLTVTYGPVSRAAFFELSTGKRFPVPGKLGWMLAWEARPVFCPDGTLLLLSHYIHDAGYRSGIRVSLLESIEGKTAGYALRTDWKKVITLEYGGVNLDRDRLSLTYIDLPQAFFTTSSDTTFERKQTFRIARGRAYLLQDEKKQPELRFLHDWMLEARRAKKPNVLQKRFRTLSWEAELLDDVKITHPRSGRTAVRVDFVFHGFQFQLSGKQGNWHVLSLTAYDRNQDKRPK